MMFFLLETSEGSPTSPCLSVWSLPIYHFYCIVAIPACHIFSYLPFPKAFTSSTDSPPLSYVTTFTTELSALTSLCFTPPTRLSRAGFVVTVQSLGPLCWCQRTVTCHMLLQCVCAELLRHSCVAELGVNIRSCLQVCC